LKPHQLAAVQGITNNKQTYISYLGNSVINCFSQMLNSESRFSSILRLPIVEHFGKPRWSLQYKINNILAHVPLLTVAATTIWHCVQKRLVRGSARMMIYDKPLHWPHMLKRP
jgi:hypothetical protein